jgi:hypothetical protein
MKPLVGDVFVGFGSMRRRGFEALSTLLPAVGSNDDLTLTLALVSTVFEGKKDCPKPFSNVFGETGLNAIEEGKGWIDTVRWSLTYNAFLDVEGGGRARVVAD